VTHRGLSSGLVVVSGHSESAYGPILGELTPQSVTVVVLMGLATRASIAQFLIARGWNASTPAALLLAASTPGSAVWTGTLQELSTPARTPQGGEGWGEGDALDSPGTLVIGPVVSIAAELALYHSPAAAVAMSQRQT
jgi:uroporphyrin-III C-methyltransferase